MGPMLHDEGHGLARHRFAAETAGKAEASHIGSSSAQSIFITSMFCSGEGKPDTEAGGGDVWGGGGGGGAEGGQ